MLSVKAKLTITSINNKWEEMVKILVYCATNKVNSKKYIGQTIHTLDYRKKQHINNAINNIKGGCRVFWRAIRKYGVDNFECMGRKGNIIILQFLYII